MKLRNIKYNPKLSAILIIGIFIAGIAIGTYTDRFRASDYRWIYEYGKLINYILVFGSLACSSVHPFIIYGNNVKDWKKYLTWIIIGILPILYFAFMMILIFFKVMFS